MIDYHPASGYSHPGYTLDSHDTLRVSPALTAATSSAAWPAANLAIYVPFVLERAVTVTEVWVETGSLTTSNGIEIGCYDTGGNRLFTQAMTITTASDTVTSSGMTDYVLPAGTYYMAMACDGTRNFMAGALSLAIYGGFGCVEQTGLTGASLPSTWTPVAFTRSYLPLFGFSLQATAV